MACLDVETILSFVEGRLPADQRLPLERHLGTCESCREQVSLAVVASLPADDGAPPTAADPAALAPGTHVGRYTVLELVGSGGMGEVYAAYDPQLDRKVALKLLRAGDTAADDGGPGRGHDRLLREAKAIAKLRHPSVVVIHDAGTVDGRVFLAMEFVEGATLRDWLAERPRAWREVLDVFIAAGRGLAAAHAGGLVHRDFKPANVMVSDDGSARVMDFGLVQSLSDDGAPDAPASPADTSAGAEGGRAQPSALTRTGELVGTPLYMAPEQFQGRRTDARTDQFAFCVALYEALYGGRPFAGATLASLMATVVEGRVDPPPARTPVPAAIRRAVLRGLRVAPDERWPSMEALLAALTRHPLRRRALPVAAVCLAVAVAGGILARVERRPALLCRAGATRLAGIWETAGAGGAAPRRAAIHDAFLRAGTAGAAEVWRRTAEELDRYAGQWVGAYADACEATHVRGEQSPEVLDLRMTCLSERLARLQALTTVFAEATPTVVSNAISAVTALPSLDRCSDLGLLRAVVPPPDDRATRERVTQLGQQVARVRALGDSGQCTAADASWHAVVRAARELGYAPLEAAAIMALVGSASECEEPGEMIAASKRAALIALASRDDETAAAAAIVHAHWLADRTSDISGARDWIDLGDSILKRLPRRPPALEAWRLGALARTFEKEGDADGAWNTFQQQLAFIARTEGPEHLDYMKALNNAAGTAEGRGRFDQALEYLLRAEALSEKLLGPDNVFLALQLDNAAEALNGLHRFDEARASATRAMEIYRRSGSTAFYQAVSLTLLGEAWLGMGKPDQARPVLEDAIRAFGEDRSTYRWQAAFGLARALPDRAPERERARSLAREARDGFTGAGATKEAAAVDAWLAKCCQ
ncbi:MAG TPA: serine/threonine-protein kinase [Polyangia bacterium]|nr:serine/threonine-protein kinase [Polyangia bacterium]